METAEEPSVRTLGEIAETVGGSLDGDPALKVNAVCGIEDATPGSLVRVESARFLADALKTPAVAFLIDSRLGPVDRPAIRVKVVRLAYIQCLQLFSHESPIEPGVEPGALVHETAEIDPGAWVGARAVIGPRSRVAAAAKVHSGAHVGADCEVGEGSELFPGVVLYPRTRLGTGVRIHAGSVIGGDGFGYEWDGTRHVKRPHLGGVCIGNDVEIGANTCVDRGTTGDTVIGPGTKIDNQVQIGHNVQIGPHCIIVAQVAIAGSARLGAGVVLAGHAAVNPGAQIGDGSVVAGKSGVWSDLEPGSRVSGNPARPHREQVRIIALMGRLPELYKRMLTLERRLGLASEGGDES